MEYLGRIKFVHDRSGKLYVDQGWNPNMIPSKDRLDIADTLREIASELERDRFEIRGKYSFRKAPMPKNAEPS